MRCIAGVQTRLRTLAVNNGDSVADERPLDHRKTNQSTLPAAQRRGPPGEERRRAILCRVPHGCWSAGIAERMAARGTFVRLARDHAHQNS